MHAVLHFVLYIFYIGSINHWICISTVGSRGMIHVMDSLETSLPLNRKTVLQICKAYSVAPSSSLKVKKLSVQQQQGSVDCGVYCIVYATETCLGNDVNYKLLFIWYVIMHPPNCYLLLYKGILKVSNAVFTHACSEPRIQRRSR